MKNKFRLRCLCCNKKNLHEIIDLGLHSFADRFVPKGKLDIIDPKYPLVLDMCNNCKRQCHHQNQKFKNEIERMTPRLRNQHRQLNSLIIGLYSMARKYVVLAYL